MMPANATTWVAILSSVFTWHFFLGMGLVMPAGATFADLFVSVDPTMTAADVETMSTVMGWPVLPWSLNLAMAWDMIALGTWWRSRRKNW